MRRRQVQAWFLGHRAGDEDGHRHDGFGRGGAAVVAGLQRPVPQLLVDGEHGPAVVQHDPAAGDQHLPVAAGSAADRDRPLEISG